MRNINRHFRDQYGIPVRVIRWEPESNRVIYLREAQGYKPECFSPLDRFLQYFKEIEGRDEPDI
ncbi:DUF4222 domain-containing protein [Phytobacter diazotrophicus]|uniref:DUF4222 domain-containing protein n=1 Tax=Phytobacter diazotrophicus TaxID=395631 RepID=UPI00232C97E0|nr:DUF4222 domain-containing protein [Phytobacter diazotrophicus]MDC0726588.1 DUF4222 domain-containing protein [Phytobacter diazotrophicus]MDC0733857.1 DUF4222 domain-containing protein [Phytobacter diazotrophicus]